MKVDDVRVRSAPPTGAPGPSRALEGRASCAGKARGGSASQQRARCRPARRGAVCTYLPARFLRRLMMQDEIFLLYLCCHHCGHAHHKNSHRTARVQSSGMSRMCESHSCQVAPTPGRPAVRRATAARTAWSAEQ